MVAGSLVAVAGAMVLMYFVVRFASENPEKANLGDRVFQFQAGRLSKEIAERGPFLVPDPLDRGRDLYVQHLGPGPEQGWVALLAYASEPDADCAVEWDAGKRVFRDPCTARTYPADGSGLRTFPTTVDDGVVTIDLRSPPAPT